MPLGTVKSHMRRALLSLRAHLDGGDRCLTRNATSRSCGAARGSAGVDAETPAEPLDVPPPGIWDRIAHEVDARDGDGTTAIASQAPVLVPPAAAAAVVLVVALIAAECSRWWPTSSPTWSHSATLEPLGPPDQAPPSSSMPTDPPAPARHDDVDADDGFLEVWLIDPAVERLVSLGPLRSDGRYDLPAGLDPGPSRSSTCPPSRSTATPPIPATAGCGASSSSDGLHAAINALQPLEYVASTRRPPPSCGSALATSCGWSSTTKTARLCLMKKV